jgi:hypothetical protein
LQVAGDELQFFLGGLRLGCCHGCGVVGLEGVCDVFIFFCLVLDLLLFGQTDSSSFFGPVQVMFF